MHLFLLILLGIDWASGYAIAGYCITHQVSPYGYAFWQSFGPMVLIYFARLLITKKARFDFHLLKYVSLASISGIVIPNLLIYILAAHVPSGLLTLLANISPLFVYTMAISIKEEFFNTTRLFAVIFGLIGVFMILGAGQLQLDKMLGGMWLAIALLIPISYAFGAVYISRFRPSSGNALDYAFGMLVIAAIFNTPLVYLKSGFYPLQLHDINTWLIMLEILLSGLGYILMFIIIRLVGAVYYTCVNMITALTGIIYGYFIFHQRYPHIVYAAMIAVMIALALLTWTQRTRTYNIAPVQEASE